MSMGTIYVDVDWTICETPGDNYEAAVPMMERIDAINRLYEAGHRIVYWTARGATQSRARQRELVKLTWDQLNAWGCKYHDVKCDKPHYDLFIEDKAGWFFCGKVQPCHKLPSVGAVDTESATATSAPDAQSSSE